MRSESLLDCRLPNLLIAGTVRSGTTSLFSYLLMHPEICGSSVKETCHFLPLRYGQKCKPLSDYCRYFAHCRDQKYIVESTPGYFEGGAALTNELRTNLGEPRIIILLRDPVDRLHSFFTYQKAQVNLPKSMEFEQYVELCQRLNRDALTLQSSDTYWGVEGGRYMSYLPDWFTQFGRQAIKILFFEDLVDHGRATLTCLSEWLGIDDTPFDNVDLVAENRTIPYKMAWAQRLAIRANRSMEPFLRRAPTFKRFVRSAYYNLNAEDGGAGLAQQARRSFVQLYEADNCRLAQYLKGEGYTDVPGWLHDPETR